MSENRITPTWLYIFPSARRRSGIAARQNARSIVVMEQPSNQVAPDRFREGSLGKAEKRRSDPPALSRRPHNVKSVEQPSHEGFDRQVVFLRCCDLSLPVHTRGVNAKPHARRSNSLSHPALAGHVLVAPNAFRHSCAEVVPFSSSPQVAISTRSPRRNSCRDGRSPANLTSGRTGVRHHYPQFGQAEFRRGRPQSGERSLSPKGCYGSRPLGSVR